ncbi:toll/interleukin-1 receptor domain-containing protein [Nocardia sp. NPDC050697]|uniref:toll/interleukin-1 receptor domain-containing protein n=1 Tax=Nocardia sp. NPDC050697 TaxID=3155158 RepID=UPI0033FD06E3
MTTTSSEERAPRCFISYSHDDDVHKGRVVDIANALRGHGVDVMIDRYVEHDPPRSWPRWMAEQIEKSDVVLVVVTERYAERYSGRRDSGGGVGVDWEGSIITGELYHSQSPRVKFIPIVTESATVRHIPAVLNQTSYHCLETLSEEELVPLIRQIFGRPGVVPAPLGVPVFGLKNDPVEQASALLETDSVAAEKKLTDLAGSSDLDVAARAAFTLGEHLYQSQQYSRSVEAFVRAVECGPKTRVYEAAGRELSNVMAVMKAHFGPDGAGEFARRWIRAVNEGDLPAVWEAMDQDFRMVLAQDWILANSRHPTLLGLDRDELAKDLRRVRSAHALSGPFLQSQLKKLAGITAGIDDSWGFAEKPRRYGLDFELILFSPTDGEYVVWESGQNLFTLPVLVRRRLGEWKIANLGMPPSIPDPGWPPERIVIPVDGVEFEQRQAW